MGSSHNIGKLRQVENSLSKKFEWIKKYFAIFAIKVKQ